MAKNVYIQFARDVRLGEAQYFGRSWYLVPEKLLKAYQAEYTALTIDVRDELPGEEAPVGDSVRAEAPVEEAPVEEAPAEEVAHDDTELAGGAVPAAESPEADQPEADPGA